MKPSAPCKDCKHRYLNCHSSCKDYLSFRKALESYNSIIKSELHKQSQLRDLEWNQFHKHHHGSQS